MKRGARALIPGVLSALLLHSSATAKVSDAPAFAYQGIVDRNIFGLKPPPPPVRPEDIKPPVPDIKLTGITTILGKKQALLKTQTPAKPPQPAREDYYILTEEQRDGDIEVLAIDEKAGVVKVNNHGTIQTLDFANNGVKAQTSSPVATAGGAPPPPPMPPGFTIPQQGGGMRQIPPRPLRGPPPSANPQAATETAIPNPTVATAGGSAQFTGGVAMNQTAGVTTGQTFVGGAPPPGINQLSFTQNTPGYTVGPNYGMTADEQTLLIELNRQKLRESGNAEEADMLPPTDATPPEGQSLF